MFHEILIESCRLNYDHEKKTVIIEPKLDYRFKMERLSVEYLTINHLSGQNTPIFFRSNVSTEFGPIGENFGIELYWSYDDN